MRTADEQHERVQASFDEVRRAIDAENPNTMQAALRALEVSSIASIALELRELRLLAEGLEQVEREAEDRADVHG